MADIALNKALIPAGRPGDGTGGPPPIKRVPGASHGRGDDPKAFITSVESVLDGDAV
jgi:hypothetical protein